MQRTDLQNAHHTGVTEAPIGVRIFNRLVLLAAAGLPVVAFGAFYSH